MPSDSQKIKNNHKLLELLRHSGTFLVVSFIRKLFLWHQAVCWGFGVKIVSEKYTEHKNMSELTNDALDTK